MSLTRAARLSISRLPHTTITIGAQAGDHPIGDKHNAPAATTITTIRPTMRHELLPPQRDDSSASMFINKLRSSLNDELNLIDHDGPQSLKANLGVDVRF